MTYPKLFVTFVKPESVEHVLAHISENYTIPNRKIWILESKESDELLLTYNIGVGERLTIPQSGIVHRQKSSNTLYSINGINALIESLAGYRDPNYQINWENYRHKYIGYKSGQLHIIHTHLKEVVEF